MSLKYSNIHKENKGENIGDLRSLVFNSTGAWSVLASECVYTTARLLLHFLLRLRRRRHAWQSPSPFKEVLSFCRVDTLSYMVARIERNSQTLDEFTRMSLTKRTPCRKVSTMWNTLFNVKLRLGNIILASFGEEQIIEARSYCSA